MTVPLFLTILARIATYSFLNDSIWIYRWIFSNVIVLYFIALIQNHRLKEFLLVRINSSFYFLLLEIL